LAEGTWYTEIENSISNYREAPNGINIVDGPWLLENSDWLALRSIDMSQNALVPTESTTFGAIKALYRR
jgi:hypothetical protein